MGGIFHKEKKNQTRITEQDQAILKLKKQRDELKRYQKKISSVLDKDRILAKKLLQEGKKDRAKLLLRKKKFQEGLLSKTDSQLDTLERLVHDLEFAQVEQQVIDGLKVGNEALKKANAMFSIEEIEKIMDDTAEAIDKQKEIDQIISGQLTQQDEEDVLEELETLLAQDENVVTTTKEKEDNKEAASEDIILPDVPTDKLPEPKAEKETKKNVDKVAVEAS